MFLSNFFVILLNTVYYLNFFIFWGGRGDDCTHWDAPHSSLTTLVWSVITVTTYVYYSFFTLKTWDNIDQADPYILSSKYPPVAFSHVADWKQFVNVDSKMSGAMVVFLKVQTIQNNIIINSYWAGTV